jgi:hypothetical protein
MLINILPIAGRTDLCEQLQSAKFERQGRGIDALEVSTPKNETSANILRLSVGEERAYVEGVFTVHDSNSEQRRTLRREGDVRTW